MNRKEVKSWKHEYLIVKDIPEATILDLQLRLLDRWKSFYFVKQFDATFKNITNIQSEFRKGTIRSLNFTF